MSLLPITFSIIHLVRPDVQLPPPKLTKRGRPRGTVCVIGLPKKCDNTRKAFCKKLPQEKAQSECDINSYLYLLMKIWEIKDVKF